MTIMNAMYSGSSALSNFGNAMNVIGNNLSNSNTTAFKKSVVTFSDILAQSIGSSAVLGPKQVGNGVSVSSIARSSAQGSYEYTGNVTDLSIDGNGFFIVKDESLLDQGAFFYTRAGDFKQDTDGRLVTNMGHVLQGWPLNETGSRLGEPKNITLSSLTASSQPTSVVDVSVNLDSTADPPANAYDPNDPESYNFSTSVRIYDSTGNGHNVELQFVKLADSGGYNRWNWYAVVESDELVDTQVSGEYIHRDTNGNSLTAVNDYDLDGVQDLISATNTTGHVTDSSSFSQAASYTPGMLKFTSAGLLEEEGSTPTTFYWSGGPTEQQILFNFGDALGSGSGERYSDSTNDFSGYDFQSDSSTYLEFTDTPDGVADVDMTGGTGTVQFAAGFSTLNLSQDGFPAGFLDEISVDRDGKIFGSFTNGQIKPLYQISLAKFPNETALAQRGNNMYAETFLSGQRIQGTANSGGLGGVISHSLEQSNVDLSEEFVKMITVQRGFQANSRIVSVVDGMMEELINLKR